MTDAERKEQEKRNQEVIDIYNRQQADRERQKEEKGK